MSTSVPLTSGRAHESGPTHAVSFKTSDGAELVYRDNGGPGIPLVMLPGLGQSQLAFGNQFDDFRDRRRVITLDFRGHGFSATPDHGYRIARLAADVRELLEHLELQKVDALGWSMGASVWWSYIDLYRTSLIRRLVIVDQPTAIARVPWMSGQDQARAGSLWDLATVEQIVDGQCRSHGDSIDAAGLRWSYSGEVDPNVLDLLVSGMRQASPAEVGKLLFDHCAQDWRDVLPGIDVPTLVIGCEGSHVTTESQRATAAAIPGARAHIFPADVASSHFPFLQSPRAFNVVLERFLDDESEN